MVTDAFLSYYPICMSLKNLDVYPHTFQNKDSVKKNQQNNNLDVKILLKLVKIQQNNNSNLFLNCM